MEVNARKPKSQHARQKILSAASKLFLKGGVEALNVRAIAKQAGLSTIGIYSHFQGKQGILDTLYIEGFEHVHTAARVAKPAQREDVLTAIKAYLRIAEEYEAHYRLIFGEVDAAYVPSTQAQAAREKAFASLLGLAEAYLPNDATAQEKRSFALDIWSLVHGYVSLAHHGLRDDSQVSRWQRQVLRAVNVYLDGHAAQQSKPD